MKTHLQTAHEYGIQHALKEAGYTSLAEVEKEANELGLIEAPAAKTASDVMADLAAKLKK